MSADERDAVYGFEESRLSSRMELRPNAHKYLRNNLKNQHYIMNDTHNGLLFERAARRNKKTMYYCKRFLRPGLQQCVKEIEAYLNVIQICNWGSATDTAPGDYYSIVSVHVLLVNSHRPVKQSIAIRHKIIIICNNQTEWQHRLCVIQIHETSVRWSTKKIFQKHESKPKYLLIQYSKRSLFVRTIIMRYCLRCESCDSTN